MGGNMDPITGAQDNRIGFPFEMELGFSAKENDPLISRLIGPLGRWGPMSGGHNAF